MEVVKEKAKEINEEVNAVSMVVDKEAMVAEMGTTKMSNIECSQEQLNTWDKHVSAVCCD